jgi:hypothetical protein
LWFAICHVRALEPEHTRLKVGKILAPPAQEQTPFGDGGSSLHRAGNETAFKTKWHILTLA